MSKKIVIVESDTAFSRKLRDELAKNAFEVVETADGKGAYDLCRRERPDLVVLAVELSAGQSGYLVCGKIKKDDDLKKTPIIIIGKDPEGFEGHKKLKTRAEEYLKKPFAPEALTVKVGVLIGLPEQVASADELVVDDDAIQLAEDAEPTPPPPPIDGTVRAGDPELDMLDDAFASMSNEPSPAAARPPTPPPPPSDFGDDEGLGSLDALESTPADILPEEPEATKLDLNLSQADEDFALERLDGPGVRETTGELDIDVQPAESARPGSRSARPASVNAIAAATAAHQAELGSLRGQLQELEDKVSSLESTIAEKDAELAAARASAAGGKDTAALKESALRKDKEILRLKQELHEKETELIDLREKEAAFEAQANSSAGEIAKRDAQIKALTQRADQLSADKRRVDTALTAAKDEARNAATQLATVQGELDQAHEQIGELNRELDELRARSEALAREAEDARASAQSETETLRNDLESVRNELELLRSEHESLRSENDARVRAAEDEATRLRSRISELEENNAKNEDRVVKAYQKIKGDEKLREKTRKAISVALQLLDESAGSAANLTDENDLRP